MATNLAEFRNLAQDEINKKVNSNQFQSNPLLGLWLGRSRQAGKLDRPGGLVQLGGVSVPRLSNITAIPSNVREEPFQTAVQGGGTKPGYRGNSPVINVATMVDETLRFYMTDYLQPFKVFHQDLRSSRSPHGTYDLLVTALDSAMNELENDIANDIFRGSPGSQTANVWDDLLGLRVSIDDGTNTTTYGGVDKTVTTILKPALYSETAVAYNWSLHDDVDRTAAALRGPGIDLSICNPNLYYQTIKPKAIADGRAVVIENASDMPISMQVLGFRNDVVKYGNVHIMSDRNVNDASGSNKSMLFHLTASDWYMEIDPRENFKVTEITDESLVAGGDLAFSGHIKFSARMFMRHPKWHGLHTDVA